jgi:micrococcal nuclease
VSFRIVVCAVTALGLSACSGASTSLQPVLPTEVPARAPVGEVREGLVVDRVVDGDTIKVTIDGRQVSVRMIGIDTPESVKPDSPVECFGPEASRFAEQALTNEPVVLEFDETQGYLDRFERVLAHVWRVQPDGTLRLFNEEAVESGVAIARRYGDAPHAWEPTLSAAQDRARAAGRGLWSACPS